MNVSYSRNILADVPADEIYSDSASKLNFQMGIGHSPELPF